MFDKKIYQREYMRKYRKEHPEKNRLAKRRWKEKNKDKVSAENHRQYLRRKALKEAERKENADE